MNPFNCSGTITPKMFGRRQLLRKILMMLDKPIPDHISIIGPKRYGKTVLLRHLHGCTDWAGKYVAIAFIDLRHESPQTDSEFRSYLANCLRDTLNPVEPTYSEMLKEANDASIPDVIKIILNDLYEKKKRIAIILDAFDHLPLGTSIHPQLLEQLRSFAQISSLRLIIGSRSRLRELCKSEESRNSDFWRIFAEPIHLGVFDDSDFEDLWEPFEQKSITFEEGAKTEIKGQTGGIPQFIAGLMEKFYDQTPHGGKVSQRDVITLVQNYQRDSKDTILDVWEDCTQETRNMLVDLAQNPALSTMYPAGIIEQAVLRGLIRKEGQQIRIHTRIIGELAKSESASVQDMNRLFARTEDYEKNIKRLLELRYSQIQEIGKDLHNYAQSAISDIENGPKRVLANANGIVEEAIKIITQAENIAVNKKLPDEWNNEWRRTNRNGPPERIDPFPADRGEQIRALSFICGCDRQYVKVSGKVSKQSYILLRKINDFSNYLRHRGDEEPTPGMAVLLCMTTLELIHSLGRDLSAS